MDILSNEAVHTLSHTAKAVLHVLYRRYKDFNLHLNFF